MNFNELTSILKSLTRLVTFYNAQIDPTRAQYGQFSRRIYGSMEDVDWQSDWKDNVRPFKLARAGENFNIFYSLLTKLGVEILKSLPVGKLQHVYCLTGGIVSPTEFETLALAFPILEKADAWLVYLHGSRYGDSDWLYIEGDINLWAEEHRRNPRSCSEAELEAFFSNGRQKPPYNLKFPEHAYTVDQLEYILHLISNIEINGLPWYYSGG